MKRHLKGARLRLGDISGPCAPRCWTLRCRGAPAHVGSMLAANHSRTGVARKHGQDTGRQRSMELPILRIICIMSNIQGCLSIAPGNPSRHDTTPTTHEIAPTFAGGLSGNRERERQCRSTDCDSCHEARLTSSTWLAIEPLASSTNATRCFVAPASMRACHGWLEPPLECVISSGPPNVSTAAAAEATAFRKAPQITRRADSPPVYWVRRP